MAPLSPFHSELLEFLQRETKKRAEEEGFYPERDPEFRAFREHLFDRDILSLPEILEKYRYLFEVRGPIHIEQRLLEVFSRKEFAVLGMEQELPRIYRALPRLYRPGNPAQSRIKPNFTHLPTLVRLMVERILGRLYEGQEVSGEIVVFTQMIADGLGDFYAAAQVVERLRQSFSVEWVVFVPKKYKLPEHPLLSHVVRSFPFRKEVGELFRSADVVLQIPTYCSFTEKIRHKRLYSIGEYGFVESSWFHPRSGNRSMGLHFLEKGILLPKPTAKGWKDLQCEALLQWRKPANRFYLAYLATMAGGTVYLHALFKSLEEDERDIDLCIPDLRWLIRLLEEKGSLLELNFGIQSIEISFDQKIHTLSLAKEGKRVRIFSPGVLSHADFQTLLLLSENFAAVRGNQSFSEAAGMGKVFFYDGCSHVRYFFKDLLALSENRLRAYPKALICLRGMAKAFLYNLPLEEGEWVDEVYFQEKEPLLEIALEIGTALKSSEVAAGFKKLSEILREEHSFQEFLDSFVRKELYCARHPEVAEREKKHLDHLIAGDCSLSELILSIKLPPK